MLERSIFFFHRERGTEYRAAFFVYTTRVFFSSHFWKHKSLATILSGTLFWIDALFSRFPNAREMLRALTPSSRTLFRLSLLDFL